MPDPVASPTALSVATPSSSDSYLSLLNNILSSNTGKGAALGALMSTLLSSYKGPGGVNEGVDMSKVGDIAPRTTQIPTGRYVPYAEYGARDVQAPTLTPELSRVLGISTPMAAPLASSQYTARPQMVTSATPQTITSAGTGLGKTIEPTVTPRSSTSLNPLLGGLLGASLGYLMPTNSASAASGSAAGKATDSLIDKIVDKGKDLLNIGGGYSGVVGSESLGSQDAGFPINEDLMRGISSDTTNWDMKDGGMATSLMADGGQVPSYYTYGQIVNPADILNQMAQGGQPKQGGLHVPTVEGRHDYRAGARVTGEGDGQSDDIPAMLADGEYVIDAETVAQLGNGSTKAGSDLLDKFREEIRGHKRSAPLNKIPPQSKSPLAYLATAQKKLGAKNG
jgi:hypothetical protein